MLILDHDLNQFNPLKVWYLVKEFIRDKWFIHFQEQECLELRKERDEKEEKLKNVYSQMEAKGAEVHYLKSRNL